MIISQKSLTLFELNPDGGVVTLADRHDWVPLSIVLLFVDETHVESLIHHRQESCGIEFSEVLAKAYALPSAERKERVRVSLATRWCL